MVVWMFLYLTNEWRKSASSGKFLVFVVHRNIDMAHRNVIFIFYSQGTVTR